MSTPTPESTIDVKAATWLSSIDKDGSFKRKPSVFRNKIGDPEFPAEANRYHIYWSGACPWAHRTLLFRSLKGLEDVITVTIVDWFLQSLTGWKFYEPEPINKFERLRQVYELCDPEYSGNVTVPVLFDKKTNRIVNNESSEIIRMLNTEFNHLSSSPKGAAYDFYPADLAATIDETNDWVYPTINNGVYRCGFAQSQAAYEKAFDELFKSLDRLEGILSKSRYLTGDRVTEADIRLFTTLIRFDVVYVSHFKCNARRIIDYQNIDNYLRELYQVEQIKKTVLFDHIKNHYFQSHKTINPFGVVPVGPIIDFEKAHDRDQKFPNVKSFASHLQ